MANLNLFARRFFFAILLAGLLPLPIDAAAPDRFLIYLWGLPNVPDDHAKAAALQEAGFNVVDCEAGKLDIVANHGLQAMVHGFLPTNQLQQLSSDRRVWGYHLADEPYPEDEFPRLAEQVRSIERLAPGHVPFINMLSTGGDFLRTYMQIVRPNLLSFDYYQWWWGSDRYFEKLEQFREAALLARVPLAACVEASANPAVERGDSDYLPDNLQKLRQSVYTTLAYGAKGIEWFSANLVFEPNSTRLSQTGRDVAALNKELQRLGPVLFPLRSIDVFHTAPLPAATRTAPKDYWIHLLPEEGRSGLVQGMFQDDSGRDYLWVVNRDYRDSQVVVVRLQSKWRGIAPWNKPKEYTYQIEYYAKGQDQWRKMASTSSVGFNTVLGPGDGDLFRITTVIRR